MNPAVYYQISIREKHSNVEYVYKTYFSKKEAKDQFKKMAKLLGMDHMIILSTIKKVWDDTKRK